MRDTGNVFEVSRVFEDGRVKLERIGIMRDGEYEENSGIPAIVGNDWMKESVKADLLAPAVRMMGGGIMLEEEYANGNLWRYERD